MLKFICLSIMITAMKNNMKLFSLSAMTLTFNMSFQNSEFSKMSMLCMADSLSFWLTNLSLWIMLMISSMKMKSYSSFLKSTSALLITLFITFSVWNFMTFYIMFEILMGAMLIFIIMWGYQPERLEASLFMIFFTITFSTPFFISINLNYLELDFSITWMEKSVLTFMGFMMVFMVKLPLFFIHLWLPKAHVESPAFGSMILAAIMLKLGGYGIIRMGESMTKFTKQNSLFLTISLWSALLLSSICMMQNDLKIIVAYSSIVHMMIMLTNIIMYKQKSVLSSLIIMMGHGLTSSLMFFILNLSYNTTKSRSSIINKGALQYSTGTYIFWFMACMSNAPMPPSMNMLGEILCMKSILTWNSKIMLMMVILMFMSSMYSIYLFYIKAHSRPSSLIKLAMKSKSNTLTIMAMHTVPLMAITTKIKMIEM